MNIEDVIARKAELEKTIHRLIVDFNMETSCAVEAIELHNYFCGERVYQGCAYVSIRVEIP